MTRSGASAQLKSGCGVKSRKLANQCQARLSPSHFAMHLRTNAVADTNVVEHAQFPT